MTKIKKSVFALIVLVTGFLLTLSGLNLIQLSANLILYSGLILLSLSILIYFLS